MLVPWRGRGVAGAFVLGAALAASGIAFAADKNGPAIKLAFEDLGIPGISNSFLDAGTSMLTIHLLDDSHLLVTFSKRGLLPRLEGEPIDHDDRVVVGEVLELPTGAVLAQTEWRMHDHARYLWSLGQGRFLLRIGNSLSTFAPLAKLNEKDPFARTAFPWRHGRPNAIFVSEDGGMMTLLAQVAAPNARPQIDVGDTVQVHQDTTTLMEFYRLKGEGSVASPLMVGEAGSLRSPQPFYLPLDSRGYLWAEETGNNQWSVTFDDMQGKTASVGKMESSCTPRLEMVSHSEYVALTCRGADDRVRLASWGLDAQETWQEDLGDLGPPAFQAAATAGRFAMSRKLEPVVLPGMPGPPRGVTDASTGADRQEIRVYQTASGNLLLKTEAFPAIKTAENFSLSEDGSLLAVVREGAIEVFKLPALSAKDKEDVIEVAKFSPPEDTGPVLLGLLTGRPKARETVKAGAVPAPEPAELADLSATVDAPVTAKVAGPAAPKRKPPTLLKPGEKAQFGGSKGGEQGPQ